MVSFRIRQPDVPIARSSGLTGVWVDQPNGQVALVYRDGVTIMMAAASYHDPRVEFARFLRENHANAMLGLVGRRVALLIAPHSDATRSNPAWVEFDQGGIDINVVSATHGVASLLEVARSLAER